MINNLKPYIIGETAYHHQGDVDYLLRMVDEIAELRINAVKFHVGLNPHSRMQRKHPLFEKANQWALQTDQWNKVFKRAIDKGLDLIVLCHDVDAFEYINQHSEKFVAVEVHAIALNDLHSLENAAKFENTIILGIGGSTIDEIAYAVDYLKERGKKDIILMYGFQSYPTNYENINLVKMHKIKNLFNLPVGYADHTRYDDLNNEMISVMPYMMGFNILEKHFTPDYGVERIDYHAAVGKKQLLRIKELMDLIYIVRGTGELKMSEPELAYGNVGPMKKAIVAKENIKKGDRLSMDNVWFKRTEEESVVKQFQITQLLGLEVSKDIEEDEIIDFTKVIYKFKKKDVESFTNIKKD